MGKVAGKSLVFQIGSPLATVGIFDPNLQESADEIDVTDSQSTGDSREYITGFINRQISFSQWYKDDVTPPAFGDELPFSWGIGSDTVTGTLVITGRTLSATREDAHRLNFTARITGAVTGLA